MTFILIPARCFPVKLTYDTVLTVTIIVSEFPNDMINRCQATDLEKKTTRFYMAHRGIGPVLSPLSGSAIIVS